MNDMNRKEIERALDILEELGLILRNREEDAIMLTDKIQEVIDGNRRKMAEVLTGATLLGVLSEPLDIAFLTSVMVVDITAEEEELELSEEELLHSAIALMTALIMTGGPEYIMELVKTYTRACSLLKKQPDSHWVERTLRLIQWIREMQEREE